MPRRTVRAAVLGALTIAAACGGRTEESGGLDGSSGLPPARPLTELNQTEMRSLCGWYVEQIGGDGAEYRCEEVVFRIDADSIECDGPPPSSCTATVSDVEACAQAKAGAYARCDLESDPTACQRLRGCESSSSACAEGSTTACSCPDGSSGEQVCGPDGTISDCECALPCAVVGVTRPCACGDGSIADQVCQVSEVWGTCHCLTGACNPDFCPAGSGGGVPCCVTGNGPCGVDTGAGCSSSF